MADKDQAAFKLRFEHLSSAQHGAWADVPDLRFRFWGPFITPTGSASTVDTLEAAILEGRFASSLADRISRGAGVRSDSSEGATVREGAQKNRRLSRESFSVSVVGPIRYGSAEITVILDGVKRVAEAFDNNFELFRSALEAYAPEAWNHAVPAPSTALLCEVRDADALKAAFDTQVVTPPPSPALAGASSAEDEKARRLRWLWITSNTSLILPCLLALAVLYVASQHVSHFEHSVSGRMARLEAREGELLKTYQAREAELHKTLLDTVKAASARASEAACCCLQRPSDPIKKPQPKKDATCRQSEAQAASAPRP